MSTWMLLPFLFGFISFLGSIALKKFRTVDYGERISPIKADEKRDHIFEFQDVNLWKQQIPASSRLITDNEWIEINSFRHEKRKNVGEINKESFFHPKEGVNVIRLLPSFEGPLFVARQQHYIESNNVHQCGKKQVLGAWLGKCPICEFYNQGHDYLSPKLKPVERFYYNILHEGQVKLISVGKNVQRQILSKSTGLDCSNLVTGRNLKLTKTMDSFSVSGLKFPSYDVEFYSEKSPIGTAEFVRKVMSQVYNLDDVVKKWDKTLDELNAVVHPATPVAKPPVEQVVESQYSVPSSVFKLPVGARVIKVDENIHQALMNAIIGNTQPQKSEEEEFSDALKEVRDKQKSQTAAWKLDATDKFCRVKS
jgi:hypothetical protein